MQSPILPSPLCDKELEDVIFAAGRRQMNDGETTSQSELNGQVAADLTTNSQLPCWTSPAVLTNEVHCPVFCRPVCCVHVVFVIISTVLW